MLCNKLQGIIFRPDGLERSGMQIRDQGHSLAKEAHTHSYKYFLACQLVMSQGLDDWDVKENGVEKSCQRFPVPALSTGVFFTT